MKVLVVLVILACAVNFSECDLPPEKWEMIKEKIKDCAAKEGASDVDIQTVMDRKEPDTHEGKCIMACVSEANGMIKGNKLDLEVSVAMATDSGMDGNKAREVGSACVEVTDGDRCIAAFMIIKCIHETVAAKGYH